MQQLQSAVGLIGLLALAWVASEQRRGVPWRLVASGITLALALAVLFLKVPPLAALLASLNTALDVLEHALQAGTSLVFGYLGGADPPFTVTAPAATFVLACRALPLT